MAAMDEGKFKINQSESKDRHVDLRIKKEKKKINTIIYITVMLTICVTEI